MRKLMVLIGMLAALAIPTAGLASNADPGGGGCGDSCHYSWQEWHSDGLYQCEAGYYDGTYYFWGCYKL